MRWLAFPLVIALLLPIAPARADEPQPELMTDAARSKAEDGLKLFQQQKWAEAYDAFRVAEELFHAPTLLERMARCQEDLGHLLAARDLYRRVAGENLPDAAPAAYRAAVEGAKARLPQIDRLIPRVRIAVSGVASNAALVRLDGKPTQAAPYVNEIDPGQHRIEARAPGAEAQDKRFTVSAGESREVTIYLAPIKPKTVIVPRPARVGLAPGMAALGVGLAGIVAGAATGAVVLVRAGHLKDECGGFACPTSLQGEHDAIGPLATASTATFAIGGVGLAAAAVLLSLHLLPGEAKSAVTARLGPTGGALEWRW